MGEDSNSPQYRVPASGKNSERGVHEYVRPILFPNNHLRRITISSKPPRLYRRHAVRNVRQDRLGRCRRPFDRRARFV